jgi:hypothetical protein
MLRDEAIVSGTQNRERTLAMAAEKREPPGVLELLVLELGPD